MSLFDYDPEGHSLVLADGRELLVHDGGTEAPRWRTELGARLVGVGSNLLSIVSLDEVGRLTLWSHETATEVRSLDLGVPATALVHDAEGRCGAVHPGGVVTAVGGDPIEHAVPGATAAAFGADGQLLVGTADGSLHRFDAEGNPTGSAQVPGAVADVAWNAGGFFLVANGGSVHRVDGLEVSHVTNAPEGAPVRGVASSPDGSRIALHVGDQQVFVLTYPARETEGHAAYGDRTINGIAFGPGDWFGVGLDGGDGNKFHLRTGATHRTDTHPGRQHNRWVLMSGFGHPEEPPARQAPAQPAPLPTAATLGPPEPGMPMGMKVFLGVAILLLVVSLVAIGMS